MKQMACWSNAYVFDTKSFKLATPTTMSLQCGISAPFRILNCTWEGGLETVKYLHIYGKDVYPSLKYKYEQGS